MPELLYKSSTVNRVVSRCLLRSASRPMAAARYPRGSDRTKQDPRGSDHSQAKHSQGRDRVSPHPNKAARSPPCPPSPARPLVLLFLLQGSAPTHLLVRFIYVMFLCREASVELNSLCRNLSDSKMLVILFKKENFKSWNMYMYLYMYMIVNVYNLCSFLHHFKK